MEWIRLVVVDDVMLLVILLVSDREEYELSDEGSLMLSTLPSYMVSVLPIFFLLSPYIECECFLIIIEGNR